MFEHAESPSLIDITVVHIAIYLLVPVLLGNNRLRALISASFAFSIINLAHLPVTYFALAAISHLFNTLSYVEVFQQNPLLYYSLILFPLAVLVWYEGFLSVILPFPFLTSAFMCTLFLGMMLFLFYLYTRLTVDNPAAGIKKTESQLSGKYALIIQHLSRRELEVIEAVLTGNLSYKELSATLNNSVNTVKAHLKHIYKTTVDVP